MGVRVLIDRQSMSACLYDSATMRAFGPLFDYSEHDPDDFLSWLVHEDKREAHQIPADHLEALVGRWIDETRCCVEAKDGEGEHGKDCENYRAPGAA